MASRFTLLPLTGISLERIQKRALKIIVPALSYSEALKLKTVKTLGKISRGGPLVKHLPMTSQHMHHQYQMRGANKYILPKCRTERWRRSIFPSTSLAFNDH